MRYVITVMILALAGMARCFGADYAALRSQADASQAAVTSPGAECNRAGAETFGEFLVKFTTDGGFNAGRTGISPIFALKPISAYKALVVTGGHDAGYMQLWKITGPGRVKLVCGFAEAPPDYSYLFELRDGKWRLTDRLTEDF